MICYRDRTFCAHSSKCSNQNCPHILQYTEKKHVEKTGLLVSYDDFKTEFCGHRTSNYDKLEKRHTGIVYSLFMRSLIENTGSIHPSVIALGNQLMKIERKFFKSHPKIYRNLVDLSKKAYKSTLITHDNTEIDSFMVLLQLFEANRGAFIGAFGLKEAVFLRIYNHYAPKSTFELEQSALKVYETLVKEGEKELKDADYCIHFG